MRAIEDKKLEKLIFAGLIGLTVILPLAVWPGLVDRTLFKDLIFFLGIGSLLMASAVFRLSRGFNIDRQFYLILGFLGFVAASTWFSVHRETSIFGAHRLWLGAAAYLVLASIYFVALQIKWEPARIRKLMIAMVSTAAGLSLFALIKFGLKLSETGVIAKADKARALFPGPNTFAFFLMAVWPLALRLALEAGRSKAQRLLFGLAGLLIFAGNVIVFSRTGWIVSIVILLAVLLSNKKPIPAAALIVAVVAIALFVKGGDGSQTDIKSYTSSRLASIVQASSLSPRLSMWRVAKDLTVDRPLTGYGPDTFFLALVRHEPVGVAAFNGKPRTPHNFPLYIGATLGVPALILIFLIFFRAIRTALTSGNYLKQTLGLSMIAMIILSQGLIWHPYMMLPFWIFMAAVSPDKVFSRASGTSAVKLSATVIALLIIGWAGVIGAADRYYLLGTSSQDRERSQAYLNKAVTINPYADSYWPALFRKTKNKAFADRLAIVARAKRYYPLSEEPLLMEAIARSENGETVEALGLLDEAIKIRPLYAEARLLKAKVLLQAGRYAEARRELDMAVKIKTYKNKAARKLAKKIEYLSN